MANRLLSRCLIVLAPATLAGRMTHGLFGSKQSISAFLFFGAFGAFTSRASKTGQPPTSLVEWLAILFWCAAAIYATALSVTATIGGLTAVGWRPAWAILGLVCSLTWVLPLAAILLPSGEFPYASNLDSMATWIALAGYFGYTILFLLLWAETASREIT